MSFNKKFFTTGGIVAASGVCKTDSHDIFPSGVALYNLDYDASDASGNHDGTPTDVTFGVGGQINYGARFNGTSSTIDLGNTNLGITDAANFTISYWFNTNSTTANQGIFWSQNRNSNGARFGSGINLPSSGGNGSIYFGCTTTSTVYINSGGSSYSANTWVHVVGVKSSAASTGIKAGITLYVNGTEAANDASVTASASGSAATNNSIGSYGNSGSFFNGELDQVRLFSTALTSDQVSTLYAEQACVYDATANTADFPSTATAVAHYPLDNSAEDNKGTNDGTETDIEYRFGRYGQAAVFNGSSSKIDISATATTPFQASSEDFTISMWVNVASFGNDDVFIAKWGATDATRSYWFGLQGASGDNTKIAIYERSGSTSYTFNGTTSLSANTWHHIVYVRNSSQVLLYIDNSAETFSATNSINDGGTENVVIGQYGGVTASTINGSIDQVRVYSTELTSDQVSQLYNEKPETDTSNFKTVLYEGTGANQYISQVGFDLDVDNGGDGGLVWLKNRSEAYNHQVYDSVRGAGNSSFSKSLVTNNNQAESWSSSTNGYLSSFDANGFSLTQGGTNADAVNRNNNDYVAWVWKGGGDAVNIGVNSITGSTPSIASDVSANTEAGFSIVKYTGNNTSGATVAHGLDNPPEIIFIKTLQTGPGFASWAVQASVLGGNKYLLLDESDDQDTSSGYFNNTLADSDVITLGNFDVTNDNTDIIAYCWHSVSGYSKIGTYPGDGTTSGNIVYTTDDGTPSGSNGFEPSWVMIKRVTDGTADWVIYDNRRDTTNPRTAVLAANQFSDEGAFASGYDIDFLSNGFELKASGVVNNTDEKEYLFMAFK